MPRISKQRVAFRAVYLILASFFCFCLGSNASRMRLRIVFAPHAGFYAREHGVFYYFTSFGPADRPRDRLRAGAKVGEAFEGCAGYRFVRR